MLLSHLLPALCVLHLGGDHAELHPANTNLYLEVPDIESAISAYEEAPFAQLFRDEQVREFIASLTGREPQEISFGALVDMGLAEVREDLPVVGVQALELLPHVKRFSFSLSGIEFEGLTDEILAAEGEWSDQLQARAGRVRAQAVLDFEGPQSAQEAAELIRSQIEGDDAAVSGFLKIEAQAEFAGQDLDWTFYQATEDDVSIAFWMANQDSRLILGSGLVPTPGNLFPVGETLAATDAFAQSSTRLPGGEGVTVLESYTNLSGLRELPKLLDLVPGMTADLKGLATLATETLCPGGAVQSLERTRLVGSRFVTESFQRDFHAADAPRFQSKKPVTRESFELVPADAVGVWATHLDKEGIHEFVLHTLADLSGSDPENVMVTLEETYGFRPDRDLVEALGGQFVFYTMPFTGIGMPKIYVALELEDHEAFTRGMQGLGAYLAAVSDGAVEFNSKPYRKHPFMSFAPGKDLEEMTSGMDSQGVANFAPAFVSISVAVGVLEDRAVLSLSNMYTKREMKRLLKGDPGGSHAILEGSADFPEDALSYGRTDWGTILGGIYDSIRGFLPLIEQGMGEELPFEIEDMPPSSIFSEYFLPTVGWTRHVEGGVYELSESSFGPEVPVMFGVLTAAAVGGIAAESNIEAEIAPPAPEVFEEPTPHQDPQAATTETLRELKIAIVVYKSDVGRYPMALSNLLDATQNFPSGFLEGAELPADAWGRSFEYSTDEQGAEYRLWSRGSNGVDDSGAGDDIDLARSGN